MNRKTLFALVGLGAGYFFLSSRTPTWAVQADGTYKPAGVLDQLTVMLTGAQPPPKQTSTAQTALNVLQSVGTALTQSGAVSGYYDQSYSPGIVPRIFSVAHR
jgi:hypothetical protein